MAEWVPFSEAAKQLGLSETTLRRRIKDGTIRAEKRNGPYGPQWFVDPDAIRTAQEITDVVPVNRTHDLAALAHVVAEYLAKQNAELATRMDTISTAVEALSAKVDAALAKTETAAQPLLNEIDQLKKELAATKEAVSAHGQSVTGEPEVLRTKQDLAEERARQRDEEVVAKLQAAIQLAQEKKRRRWPWQRRRDV